MPSNEEQAEAIARNLLTMARLQVPIVAIITGEGGSGGGTRVGSRRPNSHV